MARKKQVLEFFRDQVVKYVDEKSPDEAFRFIQIETAFLIESFKKASD